MNWKDYYKAHTTTAEEAVKLIKSGDRVVLAHACSEPAHLVDAMVANAAAYRSVEVMQMVPMGKSEYCDAKYAENFHFNTIFVGARTRSAVAENRADFTPCFFYEVPSLFDDPEFLPVDVALVQIAPPDENGMCSLGLSYDYTYQIVKKAKLVIAQVNEQLPFTYAQELIPVDEIDCFVPFSEPIVELAPPKIGPVEEAIGRNVAGLIKDGDTLQLGIGAIPDAVLRFLDDKRDLGIHSEMFSDGVVDLVEKGIINNSRKTLHPGKCVATFLMGTRRLYDFVDRNPNVMMAPVDYVNHPRIIAENDDLISINSCVQVDLMGQVCSECIGATQISGVGGQVDFVRGAAMSRGGKSILAFPSTAAKGTVSKIVARLDDGAAVTTSRNDVDYIVTEYGVARLKGKTLRQRAKALIEIAHPDFRDMLKKEYENRFGCEYDG